VRLRSDVRLSPVLDATAGDTRFICKNPQLLRLTVPGYPLHLPQKLAWMTGQSVDQELQQGKRKGELMRRFVLSILTVALLLGIPAIALAQPPYPLPQSGAVAQPSFVVNTSDFDKFFYILIALSAINALLVAVAWSQLSAIRALLEKKPAEAPKI
jgi:hypothetical protein